MLAKKCDICGALYEIEYKPDVRINVYSHPYGDGWLDLCPKCQEHLEKFVGVRQDGVKASELKLPKTHHGIGRDTMSWCSYCNKWVRYSSASTVLRCPCCFNDLTFETL